MSDSKDTASETAEPEEQPAAGAGQARGEEAPARPRGRGLAVLALVVALAAGAAGGWAAWERWHAGARDGELSARVDHLAQQFDQARADRDSRINQLSKSLDELASGSGSGDQGLAELRDRVSELEGSVRDSAGSAAELPSRLSSLEQAQKDLEERLDDMAQRLPGSGPSPEASLALAQAEYLILAGYRTLSLEGDAQRAVTALELADRVLAGVKAPGLADARQALARELSALRAVPDTDVTGVAARLAALADRVDALPFPGPGAGRPATGEAGTAGEGWWGATKSFLGEYFTVRRTQESGAGIVAPAAQQGIREILRLELEQARIALLRRDARAYRASLGRARDLLSARFDTSARAVSQALESVESLSRASVAPQLPETGKALERLRDARRRLEGGGG